MEYEYIKEKEEIKDKTENEKRWELIMSVIKTKNDLENARRNYEFAEGNLIDYYLYEIKANQSKLDYLLNNAKKLGIEVDLASTFCLKKRNII